MVKIAWYPPVADTDLDRLQAYLAPRAAAEGLPMAYLSGPSAAGLGPAASDLHVNLVVHERVHMQAWQSWQVAGRTVTASYLEFNELRGSVERACTPNLAPSLQADEARLLAHLLLGRLVLDDGALRVLIDNLHRNADAVVGAYVAPLAARTRMRASEAFDLLACGDEASAQWAAESAVLAAADALVTSRGDLYPGTAWLRARWDRTFSSPFPQVPSREMTAHPRAFVDSLAIHQDLLVQALTGYDYPLQRFVSPGEFARDPYSAVAPAKTSTRIHHRHGRGAMLVDHASLLLYGIAHGRSRTDAIDRVIMLLAQDGIRVSFSELERKLNQLIEGELLRVRSA
ncbi:MULTISPECIES: hypothetical protein [Kitasatospora]|nr:MULTISPECIES: hypothetical protein [Kitasatospora]